MPGVFVFPGGAVSSGDGRVLPATELDPTYGTLMGVGQSQSRAVLWRWQHFGKPGKRLD